MKASALVFAVAAAAAFAGPPPLADSPCPTGAVVDAAFRDAALSHLTGLQIVAPGRSADGAVRVDRSAGLHDAQGHPWHQVSAYAANLALVGALHADRGMLPVVTRWLDWQARHVARSGPARGVVLDHWVRLDTLEESFCPSGAAPGGCADVDAHDSTAASLLLLADAYLRHGGGAEVLREPALREALELAAGALAALALAAPPGSGGLTIAKPSHPVVYTMDAVEVAAGWRAWSRVLRIAYAQPASADIALATAARTEAALRQLALVGDRYRVELGSGAPDLSRWYPDTVAQAWPLLWLPAPPEDAERARRSWQRSVERWQLGTKRNWTVGNADPDGFRWAAIAVAALCSGDEAAARRWVASARSHWMLPLRRFARPFHISDLLWLLWLAQPVGGAAAAPQAPDRRPDYLPWNSNRALSSTAMPTLRPSARPSALAGLK